MLLLLVMREYVCKVLYLLRHFIFQHLLIFGLLVLRLLELFQMHVKSLSIRLDLLDPLDYLFLKNLLALLHFMHFFVEGLSL